MSVVYMASRGRGHILLCIYYSVVEVYIGGGIYYSVVEVYIGGGTY